MKETKKIPKAIQEAKEILEEIDALVEEMEEAIDSEDSPATLEIAKELVDYWRQKGL